jgi:hypothetical protein
MFEGTFPIATRPTAAGPAPWLAQLRGWAIVVAIFAAALASWLPILMGMAALYDLF